MPKITKAIIPVGGFGTRFLPATKAQPKEMLPIVDKPVIQYVVEEAVAAGIKDIILITGQNKRAIEDHFDRNFELEYRLKQQKKDKVLNEVASISNLANFVYVRQKTPLGDGHAILCAKELIKKEPIAVLFGDDIVDSKTPCVKQLVNAYQKYQDPIIAIMPVEKKDVSRYGIVDAVKTETRTYQIKSLIEKPEPEKAPSNLAIVGKYIITPEVISALEEVKPAKDGEIRLIDGFRKLIKKRSIYAYEFEGKRYDCGNKLEFLKASIAFALKHPEISPDFKKFIKDFKNLK